MLRDDVIRAVEAGRFHIFAVDTIDQGIEVLTGRPAGIAMRPVEFLTAASMAWSSSA
jgi:hypothetical protein